MPRTTIAGENKPKDLTRFPKLKLKNGEKARILLMSMDPEVNWVHSLEMPKIENNEVLTKAGQRGGTVYDMEWVGNPICLGDFDTVTDKGVDPAGCPVCAAHQKHGDMFSPPKRRYALPLIQYMTDNNGKLTSPFMCKVVAWTFTDNIYGQLCDFQEEFGDMKVHDINLGPCENEMFQKFNINIAGNCAWIADDPDVDRKKVTATVWRDQQPSDSDLIGMCGRNSRSDYIATDIVNIMDRWNEVRRLEGRASGNSNNVDALLDEMETQQAMSAQAPETPTPASPVPEAASSGPLDVEALLAGGIESEPVEAPTAAVTELGNEGVGSGEEIDLDEILKGIDS